MLIQCIKCDRYFRSFSRIKIHKAKNCPAEIYEDIKEEIQESVEKEQIESVLISKVETKIEESVTIKRESDFC